MTGSSPGDEVAVVTERALNHKEILEAQDLTPRDDWLQTITQDGLLLLHSFDKPTVED